MKAFYGAVLVLLAICQCQGQDIRRPPTITEGPDKEHGKHKVFKIDTKIALSCQGNGEPSPMFEWYVDGSLLDLNVHDNIEKDETQPGQGSIIIDPAYSPDGGFYQCRAENKHGTALSQVLFLERALLDTGSTGDVEEYQVKEGDSLIVQCAPRKSVPTPIFTWSTAADEASENNMNVVFNKRINIDEDGNLYFSYVKLEDAKNGHVYKCNVFNNILDVTTGGSYSTIRVQASSNPDVKPRNLHYTGKSVSSTIIGLKGEDLSLKCLFEGKPEVTIKWSRDTSNSLPAHHTVIKDGTELLMEGVMLSDEATYKCTGSNSMGSTPQEINVKVEVSPVFELANQGPSDLTVTEGETAQILCQAVAIPAASVAWFVNGRPFEDAQLGSRYQINEDGTILTISDLCKDCANGGSDLQNIQCNASNVHGYAYGSGYINVLLATLIPEGMGPINSEMEYGEGANLTLDCSATSDDSFDISYKWQHQGKDIDYIPDEIYMNEENGLVIKAEDEKEAEKYVGEYTCIATNGHSTDRAKAMVTAEGIVAPVTAGSFDLWWIFIIIAVILLLLILLLCCCLCCQRNRGEAYPVDEKERRQGLDPEKELADSGFQDYQRPEDEPMKGSRASLTSTIKLDTDDEGSLAEYGDLDTGKFNEDGSFIGQYTTDKKKRPRPTESNV